MGSGTMSDKLSDDQVAERNITAWLERELDGKVVGIARLPRHRPCWAIDVETKNGLIPIFIRGKRGGQFQEWMTLSDEAELHRILLKHGVPCPRVYGMIDDPEAIVLEFVPGTGSMGLVDVDDD